MVTRWRLDGDTLRIETGLIRKDSRRLPLARVQAVDIVRPFLARLLGVAELRIRLAGSGGTDGKLAYLSEAQAAELRWSSWAATWTTGSGRLEQYRTAHGQRRYGRLLASVFLSLVTIVVVGTVAALVILDQFEPKTAAREAAFLAVYLLSAAGVIWRRLSGQYNFIAVEAAEGVRIRRGLLQTISETVPYGRIRAVRQVEPLLWRPFGWCRLEVDVAGATGRNQRGEGTSFSVTNAPQFLFNIDDRFSLSISRFHAILHILLNRITCNRQEAFLVFIGKFEFGSALFLFQRNCYCIITDDSIFSTVFRISRIFILDMSKFNYLYFLQSCKATLTRLSNRRDRWQRLGIPFCS